MPDQQSGGPLCRARRWRAACCAPRGGVDHREIEAAIEAAGPSVGYRRIYPDLPGMGRSTTSGLTCNDDVNRLLSDFIDHLGEGPVMLVGHSYGAYLARGLAARRPDMTLVDEAALGRIFAGWPVDVGSETVSPRLIRHRDERDRWRRGGRHPGRQDQACTLSGSPEEDPGLPLECRDKELVQMVLIVPDNGASGLRHL